MVIEWIKVKVDHGYNGRMVVEGGSVHSSSSGSDNCRMAAAAAVVVGCQGWP